MSSQVTLEDLQYAAQNLASMQKMTLAVISYAVLSSFMRSALNASMIETLLYLSISFYIVFGALLLVSIYRCAKGSGRSGILWIFIVMIFKWVGLAYLVYLTRKWLQAYGVNLRNLGMSFELPYDVDKAPDTPGFTRY